MYAYTLKYTNTQCILPLVYTSVNTHKVLGQLVPGPSVFPLRSLAVSALAETLAAVGDGTDG